MLHCVVDLSALRSKVAIFSLFVLMLMGLFPKLSVVGSTAVPVDRVDVTLYIIALVEVTFHGVSNFSVAIQGILEACNVSRIHYDTGMRESPYGHVMERIAVNITAVIVKDEYLQADCRIGLQHYHC